MSCLSHVYCLCLLFVSLFTVLLSPGRAGLGWELQLHVCSGCVPAGDCLSACLAGPEPDRCEAAGSGLLRVRDPGLGTSGRDTGAASEVTRRHEER